MAIEWNDEQLVAAASAGDTAALALLCERHRLHLFRTAFAELGRYDDAQDAVAEAIVRVLRYAARGGPIANIVPWMHRVVRNEARRLRLQTGRRMEEALPPDERQGGPEPAYSDLALEVRLALRQLPGPQARVMALHYLDGLNVADVAAVLGRPAGTVKWMLSSGRSKLAAHLKGYEVVTLSNAKKNLTPGVALLAAPSANREQRREMSGALGAGGWEDVRTLDHADDLLNFVHAGGGAFGLPVVLSGCDFLILDEHIGATSAFELLPLLNAARHQNDLSILLLLDAGRTTAEVNAATLSAYISGVDMLLTRPFEIVEFQHFARRMRTVRGRADDQTREEADPIKQP